MNKPIVFSKKFKKNYGRRIQNKKNVKIQFQKRLDLFQKDRDSPTLRDHWLKGSLRDYGSFSISGDIRIIYQEFKEIIVLVDVGTHNQVY